MSSDCSSSQGSNENRPRGANISLSERNKGRDSNPYSSDRNTLSISGLRERTYYNELTHCLLPRHLSRAARRPIDASSSINTSSSIQHHPPPTNNHPHNQNTTPPPPQYPYTPQTKPAAPHYNSHGHSLDYNYYSAEMHDSGSESINYDIHLPHPHKCVDFVRNYCFL
mmetsp:Transcript_20035/g.40170  ORF Transcript_20035/g.40170 Transcript_20035/m.40170 type:complete len:168 (-) Transcript_20035:692-1195(-)